MVLARCPSVQDQLFNSPSMVSKFDHLDRCCIALWLLRQEQMNRRKLWYFISRYTEQNDMFIQLVGQ